MGNVISPLPRACRASMPIVKEPPVECAALAMELPTVITSPAVADTGRTTVIVGCIGRRQ
jgi:hypothetical protein